MTLDERIAEIKASSNSQPEPEAEVNTQPATDEPKAEEVSNKGSDGDASVETKPTEEGKDSKDSLTREDNPAPESRKFSKKDKARHAFAELTSKNSTLKKNLDKVLKFLEESKGVAWDGSKETLDEYLKFSRIKQSCEEQKKVFESELNGTNDELRLLQAEAIWDNEEDLNDYKTNVIPHLAEINKVLSESAPNVAKFLKYSENAPLIEKAFMGNEGKKWLAFVNTDNEAETRDRCKAMIAELKQESKPVETKPIAPKPSRATGSVTSSTQKAPGAPINMPSIEHIRKLIKG